MCDFCDQSFRQKQLLRRHINLYHVPGYVPPAPLEKVDQHSLAHVWRLFCVQHPKFIRTFDIIAPTIVAQLGNLSVTYHDQDPAHHPGERGEGLC